MDVRVDHKESWATKNWCFWTVVLEKTLESPLDCEEIQPGHPKGNSEWWWSWSSNTLATWCEELTHWKRPWCFERLKAGGEGEHGGWDGWWHHRCDGHEFEQALEVGDGQGSLVGCNPWSHKESDTTEQLNWTEGAQFFKYFVEDFFLVWVH